MENILYINACVREKSRTKQLAEHFLSRMTGNVKKIDLQMEGLKPLSEKDLNLRDNYFKNQNDAFFSYAKDFSNADTIVISAPFWDLGIPAILKVYLENVTVSGITFCYENNQPKGLCKAKKLIYITTVGGYISEDFGYSYVKTLAETFYGIKNTVCFKAEGLDIIGNNVEEILNKTKKEMDRYTI